MTFSNDFFKWLSDDFLDVFQMTFSDDFYIYILWLNNIINRWSFIPIYLLYIINYLHTVRTRAPRICKYSINSTFVILYSYCTRVFIYFFIKKFFFFFEFFNITKRTTREANITSSLTIFNSLPTEGTINVNDSLSVSSYNIPNGTTK